MEKSKRHYKHITFNERLFIEAWQKADVPPKVMAEKLGKHVSAIYRELKRGQYEHLNSDYTTEMRYSPDIADKKYRDNLKAKGAPLKIGNDRDFADYVEYKICQEKYSPGAVLGEIERKGIEFQTNISKQTLYRYIEQGVFLTLTIKDLPNKGKSKSKKYRKVTQARPQRGESIEKRPEEIQSRESFGHWEMDSVLPGKDGKKPSLVLTERRTRAELIRLLKDHTAESVVKALNRIERKIGSEKFSKIFKSITIDNGPEFSDCDGMEKSCIKAGNRTKVYYCHPYSAYERGSNENQNKMIRRHYPKGTNFDNLTAKDIKKLESWINNYPREMFNFYSSADLLEACLNEVFSA